jgi:hypothetical protein
MKAYDSFGEESDKRKQEYLVGNLCQSHAVRHKHHTDGSEIKPGPPLVTAAQRPNRKCRTIYLRVYTNTHFSDTYTYLHIIYHVLSNLAVRFEETVL